MSFLSAHFCVFVFVFSLRVHSHRVHVEHQMHHAHAERSYHEMLQHARLLLAFVFFEFFRFSPSQRILTMNLRIRNIVIKSDSNGTRYGLGLNLGPSRYGEPGKLLCKICFCCVLHARAERMSANERRNRRDC